MKAVSFTNLIEPTHQKNNSAMFAADQFAAVFAVGLTGVTTMIVAIIVMSPYSMNAIKIVSALDCVDVADAGIDGNVVVAVVMSIDRCDQQFLYLDYIGFCDLDLVCV